jgi:hypothetical protein
MTKKFILLICFSSSLFSFANNGKSIPGYLGSKNAASIKIQPNFATSEDILRQLLRPSLGVTFERVVNRRSSFTIAFGNSKNTISSSSYYPFIENKNNRLAFSNTAYSSPIEGSVDYRNTYFSIAKSYYNLASGSLAPLGFYTKIGYTLNLQKIIKDNMRYEIGNNPNGASLYQTQYTSSLNLEFGSKRFISKNIFIQKSVAFNLPFNFWTTSNTRFLNIEDFNETNLNFYLSKARTLNISIGIGAAF